LVFEGQPLAAVNRGKCCPVGQTSLQSQALCVFNTGRLNIDAREPAAGASDQRERRPAGAAGNVKDIAGGSGDQLGDLSLLLERSPALLAEVFPIDFAPYFGGYIASKSSILCRIELKTLG
jgi:hypothetical protein